jgi:hypothetical protein
MMENAMAFELLIKHYLVQLIAIAMDLGEVQGTKVFVIAIIHQNLYLQLIKIKSNGYIINIEEE